MSGERASSKYPVEQALSVECTYAELISPSNIEDALKNNKELSRCRLYAVVRRPRLLLQGIRPTPGAVSFTFKSPSEDKLFFDLSFEPADEMPHIECNKEGTHARIAIGDVLFDDKVSKILTFFDSSAAVDAREGLLDLEVLYIGKSDDVNGPANQRLDSHSTLQKILADHIDYAPSFEIWIVAMAFEKWNTMSALLPGAAQQKLKFRDFKRRYEPKLKPKSRVALAEAAMIRHFQPKYNTHYMKSVPSKRHSSYSEITGYDYSAIGFELVTKESIGCRLWSDVAPATFAHGWLYSMESPENRRPFLDLGHINLGQKFVNPRRPPNG